MLLRLAKENHLRAELRKFRVAFQIMVLLVLGLLLAEATFICLYQGFLKSP